MRNIDYESLTPMMKQYVDIKNEYLDSILMFRLGDFYEMFFDDAEIASKELDIVLTQRGKGDKAIPMCGVPFHSSDNYINRLIGKGYKVAICEQLEDPDQAQGLVDRGVIRVITPGTKLQIGEEDSSYNFLASVYGGLTSFSLTYIDFSTGDLFISYKEEDYNDSNSVLRNQLSLLQISELILNSENFNINDIVSKNNIFVNIKDPKGEKSKEFEDFLSNLDYVNTSKEIILNRDPMYKSLLNLYTYLQETQFGAIDHIRKIRYIDFEGYMLLDRHTLYSLDIFSESGYKEEGTLLKLLDETKTAMGSRKLRYMLEHPLKDQKTIEKRLETVDLFNKDLSLVDQIRRSLDKVYDLERIMVKISGQSHSPKDLLQLRNSLAQVDEIYRICMDLNINTIDQLELLQDESIINIYNLIDQAIRPDAKLSSREGDIIKEGFSKELDDLKSNSIDSKSWISQYESKLKEETSIGNLKIKYNKILGYFIEVTKSHLDKVPQYFIRKQTLVNSERYFTEELKSTEIKLVNSKDLINELEEKIYLEIRDQILNLYDDLIDLSDLISYVDVFSNFAYLAYKYDYIRPKISKRKLVHIKKGRHPIVEQNEDIFIDNDTYIDDKENFILLTGPNMAGKSTYMRQIALISIMMQIGSFVPAQEAELPVFDRIFTRIGAHDNLYEGDSTFMVEMKEMADIINNASPRSLIILDEIGRGTSTYDGLALARALIEYIIKNIDAKTIFATHFHELIELEDSYPSIKNQTIAVDERDGQIQFLRKVIDGSSDQSYGIHVAKLAGVKNEIVNKAKIYLKEYENKNSKEIDGQINLFEIEEVKEEKNFYSEYEEIKDKYDILENKIREVDINTTTPLDSLLILKDLKEYINEK